jgi:hypothetical protein
MILFDSFLLNPFNFIAHQRFLDNLWGKLHNCRALIIKKLAKRKFAWFLHSHLRVKMCIHDPHYLGLADRSADQQSSHFRLPREATAHVDDLQGQLAREKKTKGLQRARRRWRRHTHLACLSCRERANVDVFGYKKNKVHGVVICTWPSTLAFPGEAQRPLSLVYLHETWGRLDPHSWDQSVLCTQRGAVSLYLLLAGAPTNFLGGAARR